MVVIIIIFFIRSKVIWGFSDYIYASIVALKIFYLLKKE
jgi:hypothetical protein